MHEPVACSRSADDAVLRGAWCALGPLERKRASIEIVAGRVVQILDDAESASSIRTSHWDIDLNGFLVMPGLVNAHDHLQFALFPRLADPPYRNYIDWGTDIHEKFPDVIAKHRAVPKDVRLWWGGVRNLLCGVTTVCHHDALWPELKRRDFPVRVVQEYGWGHSLALGGDLLKARSIAPEGSAFILHACEGVDEQAYAELAKLDELGLLDERTVLVHGLAIDEEGVALVRARRVSLIVCPSSNQYLFQRLPEMALLGTVENIALGNDSPLTAEGDLLDEVRFAGRAYGIQPDAMYRMVTEAPAAVLRLRDHEGSIKANGVGDLMAVRDNRQSGADRLRELSMHDVEFVMVAGRVQLASETIMKRLPEAAVQGLEPLWIDGAIRWLRAPVRELLTKAEEVFGKDEVRLGGRMVRSPL
jgi:cytosine/adenosine deaminase-related metal-dependent hydrolase